VADGVVVEGLTKRFGNAPPALDQVSFAVDPGTFLVLLGPSGSGKTTLLRILAGIERATSGRVMIGDKVVSAPGLHLPPERRQVSMVFQDYALWPHLCARDNVAFALRRRNLPTDQRRSAAVAMLERVGLGHLSERFPGELSGGEQQRVAVARALVADTSALLCDEPLSNLDADLRERLRVEIAALVRQAGATTVYITHDQAEAFALADKVGVLTDGRLVQFGSPEDVYAHPATPFVARFTGSAGELAVDIQGPVADDGTVTVRPVTSPVGLPIRAQAAVRAGARSGLLTIRPAAVEICGVDEERCHLTGAVADVAFRGHGYELVIQLDGGEQIRSVRAATRTPLGERVGLHLDSTGCVVFDEPPSQNGRVELPALAAAP
jgi:iron(III) transport system ATP-binding protein